jgi:hypothetical protein
MNVWYITFVAVVAFIVLLWCWNEIQLDRDRQLRGRDIYHGILDIPDNPGDPEGQFVTSDLPVDPDPDDDDDGNMPFPGEYVPPEMTEEVILPMIFPAGEDKSDTGSQRSGPSGTPPIGDLFGSDVGYA